MKIKYVIVGLIILLLLTIGASMLDIFKKDIKIENIKKLEFDVTNNMSMYGHTTYKLECNDKCIASIKPNGISEDETQEVELTKEQVKEIEDLLNEYHVGKWNGFDKVDKNVLDGRSFSLYITLEDNTYISAHGYMKYPKNYKEVSYGLNKIIGSLYKEKEDSEE